MNVPATMSELPQCLHGMVTGTSLPACKVIYNARSQTTTHQRQLGFTVYEPIHALCLQVEVAFTVLRSLLHFHIAASMFYSNHMTMADVSPCM